VANVAEALQAVCHLDASIGPPAWLDGTEAELPAAEVVAVANGLLHLPTRVLRPHTPTFFSPHSLPFDYDPSAPAPLRWHRFNRELWDDDTESIDTLGEVMGYLLGGGTSQQKLFMMTGPRRSGKGTIGRVLTGLLGVHNTAAPTLASLTTNFGLSPLIGKPLAVISDARLSTRADGSIAVERLLSISGEDSLTIDRKYREPWTGRLPTRFLILTNELPRFTDSSGALASRFVLLTTSASFYGREDPTLTDALLAEAPGIFNWALEGLDRLRERGYFVQPETAQEALRHLEDLSSPVGAFVRDRCKVGPAHEVGKDALFDEWKSWCSEEGRDKPGTKAMFIRDLRAAVPGIVPGRTGARGSQRTHVVRGLALERGGQLRRPLTRTDTQATSAPCQGVSGDSPIVEPTRSHPPAVESTSSERGGKLPSAPSAPSAAAPEPASDAASGADAAADGTADGADGTAAVRTLRGRAREKPASAPGPASDAASRPLADGADAAAHPRSHGAPAGCGHPRVWLARDGVRRCLVCEPPAFPAEVVSEEWVRPIVVVGDDGYLDLLHRAHAAGHLTDTEREGRGQLHFALRRLNGGQQ
jgi:putative DNA primase/helicase